MATSLMMRPQRRWTDVVQEGTEGLVRVRPAKRVRSYITVHMPAGNLQRQ